MDEAVMLTPEVAAWLAGLVARQVIWRGVPLTS